MHRHQYKGRKFKREAGPRKALLRNLASQLILHEKITTTLEKAKELRPIVERLITKAKRGTLADRRNVEKFLSFNDKSAEKLFSEIGGLYKDRNGGYTRIMRLPNRVGDNAKMAVISLLDTEKLTKKAIEEDRKSGKPEKTDSKKIKSQKTKESVSKNNKTKAKATVKGAK